MCQSCRLTLQLIGCFVVVVHIPSGGRALELMRQVNWQRIAKVTKVVVDVLL